MADYFDSAAQRVDQQKRDLLAAIAQQGSQAKASYEQSQAALAAEKQKAVTAALADASRRGAPAATQQGQAGQVGGMYEAHERQLREASDRQQASLGHLAASSDAYMTNVGASLPALRGRLAETVSTNERDVANQLNSLHMQAQEREAERRAAAEQREWQRSMAEREFAATERSRALDRAMQQQEANRPRSITDILGDVFGGAGGFVTTADSVARERVPQMRNEWAVMRGGIAGPGNGAPGEFNSPQDFEAYDRNIAEGLADTIGQNAGLPPGFGRQIYGEALSGRGTGSASQLRNSPEYGAAVGKLREGLREGATYAQLSEVLLSLYPPEIARQVLADFGDSAP